MELSRVLCWKVYVVRCTIWYHLYNFKNVKNTHGGVLILVKLQTEAFPWVFFTFFKLYKWYQIAQRITYSCVLTRKWFHQRQRLEIFGDKNIPIKKVAMEFCSGSKFSKNISNNISKKILFHRLRLSLKHIVMVFKSI